jgi:hypothetical protein
MYLTDFSTKRFNIDFTFVENKGRVYTPYTMLSRDLEQFVYFTGYDNEPSITLDMPNSQLCFYSELIERRKKIDDIGRVEDNKKENDNMRIIKELKISDNTDVFSSLNITTPYVVYFSPNWEDYIFNGYGYERMMYLCKWKNKEHSHTKEERQEFKEVFFGQLFYNKYDERLTDLEMIFYTNHTKTAMELRKLKQKLGNKLLAIEVQKLESDFFHKILVGYIVKKYPNIPFIIKHDSITLPKSEALTIADELNKLVKDFFRCDSLKLKMS